MSLLELGGPHDAEDRLDVLGRTVGLRESLRLLWERKSVRGQLVATLLTLPLGGFLIAAGVDPSTSLITVGERAFIAVFGIGLLAIGLDSSDQLACVLTASHECRHCRSETERWGAEAST